MMGEAKMCEHTVIEAYHKEPPAVKFIDHLFSFLSYVLLAIAGWIVYSKAIDGLRPDVFAYSIALTITSGIASLGALLNHYRFELAMLPFITAIVAIYAIALSTLPDDSQGVFFIAALGFLMLKRWLHLSIVATKARKTKMLENASECKDGAE